MYSQVLPPKSQVLSFTYGVGESCGGFRHLEQLPFPDGFLRSQRSLLLINSKLAESHVDPTSAQTSLHASFNSAVSHFMGA